MDKPIEELFPELMDGYPAGKKWADLPPLAREGAVARVLEQRLGVVMHINDQTPPEVVARIPEMEEWSLRHGKVHPELPHTSAKLKRSQDTLLD